MKKSGNILIVDDNRGVLTALQLLLKPYFDKITTLSSPVTLPCTLHEDTWQVVLLDMNFTSGINTIHLEIPALRERPEDIIPLAERFITRFCKQYGKSPLRLDNAAREKLMLHPWFGNIRELEHAIEKAVIICDGTFLSAGLFQLQRRNETPEMPVSTLEDMEKQMIRRTLDKCGGNLSAVASQLGITRQTLYNKMKKYGL